MHNQNQSAVGINGVESVFFFLSFLNPSGLFPSAYLKETKEEGRNLSWDKCEQTHMQHSHVFMDRYYKVKVLNISLPVLTTITLAARVED